MKDGYKLLAAEVEALREVAKAAKAFLYAEQSVANYNKDNEARGWTLGPPAPPPVREKQRLRDALATAVGLLRKAEPFLDPDNYPESSIPQEVLELHGTLRLVVREEETP